MPIIHYGRQYSMEIVHHGRGRYTCTPWPREMECNAPAYDKILSIYYGKRWIRNDIVLSVVVLIQAMYPLFVCLGVAFMYSHLKGIRSENIISTDGANST